MYERFQAVYKFPTFLETSIREAAKKVPLMAGPFRPTPPPRAFGTLEKGSKKSSFFLNGPAIKRRTFFAASLTCFLLILRLLLFKVQKVISPPLIKQSSYFFQ